MWPKLLLRLQLRLLDRFCRPFELLTRKARAHGMVPDGTLGIAATGTLDAVTLRRILGALPPDSTYELCCHPGHLDAALESQNTRLRESRACEFTALLAVIPEILRTEDAPELIHYGNLGVPGLQRASGQFTPHDGFERVL